MTHTGGYCVEALAVLHKNVVLCTCMCERVHTEFFLVCVGGCVTSDVLEGDSFSFSVSEGGHFCTTEVFAFCSS